MPALSLILTEFLHFYHFFQKETVYFFGKNALFSKLILSYYSVSNIKQSLSHLFLSKIYYKAVFASIKREYILYFVHIFSPVLKPNLASNTISIHIIIVILYDYYYKRRIKCEIRLDSSIFLRTI